MHRSKIPSPARSEGAKVTPRRHRFRSSRSMSSPARSDVSVKLSTIVQMHAMDSPVLSPLKTRRSVLSDNTDIEVPGRQSWWKRLEENSRDVMEVLETKTTEQSEDIEEYIQADFKSQDNDYTVDMPDSSDGESINSIVLPQRKFFSQKQTQSNKLFNKIIENRENLTHRKSKANTDNTIFVGKKNFFNKKTEGRRSRPAFPPGLLNMTDKTLINKTHDITKHEQVRNLLGDRAGTKRKNMFADFIMSESEDEIPDIQPNVFGFTKNKQQQQRKLSSQSTRNTSPRTNETDIEFDDWQHLPSSTMVDNDFENVGNSPVKRPRLSKPDSIIEEVRGNVRNKLDKTKLTLIMSHGLENDNRFEESHRNSEPKNTHEQTQQTETAQPFTAEIIQVDSDDDNNFTLRYDNDDRNMDDDVKDVTVKELDKDTTKTNKSNTNTTVTLAKLSKSLNSMKSAEPNTNKSVQIEVRDVDDGSKTNQEQNKNVSLKVLEGRKEQNAAINIREDMFEENSNKNTSISTSSRKDACEEINNSEINTERDNNSINKEKTNSETEFMKDTSIDKPQETDILQIQQKGIQEERLNQESLRNTSKIIENNCEQIQNSVNDNMTVDGNINIGKNLNTTTEEKNTDISHEANIVKHHADDAILNISKNDTVQKTLNSTKETNTTDCAENRKETFEKFVENNDNVNTNMVINEIPKESYEQTQQMSIHSVDEIDEATAHNDDNNEEVNEDENRTEDNKSLESEKQASLNENILTDDEASEHNDEENVTGYNETINKSNEESSRNSVDENMTDDEEADVDNEEENDENNEIDEMEKSEMQNESNKETGVSMDANIETDDEENLKDSEEDDDDAEENEITEDNDEEVENDHVISSIHKSNDTEVVNEEENDEDNESDEGISDRIGMTSMNVGTDDEDNANNEVSADGENDSDAKTDHQVTLSKGRIYLTNVTGESSRSLAEEAESDPEEAQTRRLALEQYLMKIKNDNIEKRRKMEEEVRNSLKTREPFNNFKTPARPRPRKPQQRTDAPQQKTKAKKITSLLNVETLPPELLDDMAYKPPRRYQPKSAAWITKRLYKYLETKLEPKYDYKARVKAEKVVEALFEFSKEVRRVRAAPPPAVHAIKLQLARAGLVATHYDFYKFLHEFMPREIRVKVVPDVVNEIPLPRHGVFSDIV